MNYLWAGMILVGIVYGVCTGNLGAITNAMLDSSKEAIELCVMMAGIMAFWVGMMEIAKEAGLIDKITRKINPLLSFLFPQIPKEHESREFIASNMVANFLGLGWAATPAGLKAMEKLAQLEGEREESSRLEKSSRLEENSRAAESSRLEKSSGLEENSRAAGKTASAEMCAFLVLNISSLQLIPVNMIAYRSQYGSVNPTAIVGPAIVATAISTLTAVVFCKVMMRKRN